jgi:Flp pilus assembly protein TadB
VKAAAKEAREKAARVKVAKEAREKAAREKAAKKAREKAAREKAAKKAREKAAREKAAKEEPSPLFGFVCTCIVVWCFVFGVFLFYYDRPALFGLFGF